MEGKREAMPALQFLNAYVNWRRKTIDAFTWALGGWFEWASLVGYLFLFFLYIFFETSFLPLFCFRNRIHIVSTFIQKFSGKSE
jgi:hypothetical protein